jgi:hypothetical protein
MICYEIMFGTDTYRTEVKTNGSVDTTTNAASRILHCLSNYWKDSFHENNAQVIQLKAPIDFAKTLGIHINHLIKF